MNNLHRELAPISAAAWTDIEDEARRSFTLHVAGRRTLDVLGPSGEQLAAVGTGHLVELEPPRAGVHARRHDIASVVEFRVPFRVSRDAVDDVERGAKDSDWQPVKDAARELAFAEDRAVVDGFTPGAITGLRPASSNPELALPADPREYPTVVAQAASALRLAGVGGPYSLLLSATTATRSASTSLGSSATTARSSGLLPSTAPSCCPPAAGTTSCTSGKTPPSATSPTTPARSSSTSRSH
jgi:uncharacterized linocin/CFP29 family protein